MPILNGYETTDQIRNTLNSNVPIIAMTANAMHGEKEKCIEAGMNDYISKPFNSNKLAQIMSRLLGSNNNEINAAILMPEPSATDRPVKLYSFDGLPKIIRNNKTLRNEVIQRFIDDTPGLEEELKHHFDKNELASLRQAAHKLKSSFDLFQIKKLQYLARWMENIPENCCRDLLKKEIFLLQSTTMQVVRQMKKELAS